jgi:(E)-4-hydroxy-3-methyl-but-2-enyl pyrophosphate reductase
MTKADSGEAAHAAMERPNRKIVIADIAGFCFGVRRAVDMAERSRAYSAGSVTTLGPLVHNGEVTGRLKQHGIDSADTIGDVEGGTVVLSAHGVAPAVLRRARERRLDVVDTTCPFVSKVHRAALSLAEQGYAILLVGDPGHTEVRGVVAAIEEVGGTIHRVSCAEDVPQLSLGKKVGVISQTTQRTETFAAIVAHACTIAQDVRAINTVCGATEELQAAAARLARSVDMVLVVGGKASANTRRLRDVCAEQGVPAYHIGGAGDIDPLWLEGVGTIGITAGASTPDWLIEEVAREINGGSLPDDWRLQHPDA